MEKIFFRTRALSVLLLLFAGLSSSARAERIESFPVGTKGRLACTAYLHFPDGPFTGPYPLLLDQDGTGLYTTAIPFGAKTPDDPGAPGYLLRAAKAAVLTIDKPGIRPAPDTTAGFQIDHAIYDRHTQRDLVACVLVALRKVAERTDVKPDGWILSGHSEGAQVVVRAYRSLIEKEAEFAKRIHLVSLSGLPMEPWREMIGRQLENRPEARAKFWAAYARRDDAALFRLGPVGSEYWRDVFSTTPLVTDLRDLARREVKAGFAIFQGTHDKKVSPTSVTKFEEWNRRSASEGKPALRLSARYYPAGHGLNFAAENDRYLAFANTFADEAAAKAADRASASTTTTAAISR